MLPEHEWLPQAQRLAVGMRMRVRHRREGRANMTIANERDRWWCYCQRCKEGGVVLKDHVLLTAPTHAVGAVELTMPTDVLPVMRSEFEEAVGRFLATKNMMFPYLPDLYFSQRARRLLLQDERGCWHGRDFTGKSDRKWLNYHGAKFVGIPGPVTILTEDLFSKFKIEFAIRSAAHPGVPLGTSVCCTLGSGIHDAAVLALKSCSHLVWAYDADKAGDDGYMQAQFRMRPFGLTQSRARPPEGLDPKDMDCESIRVMLQGAINHART